MKGSPFQVRGRAVQPRNGGRRGVPSDYAGAKVGARRGWSSGTAWCSPGQLTGFSIDLWNAVAARLDAPTTYEVAGDTPSAFEALRAGNADVVVKGHFQFPERDRECDCSYSILNAGQQAR